LAPKPLPVIDIHPGKPYLNDERKRMSLKQLVDAIDEQRRQVFAVVAPLSDDELQTRTARIPLFKQVMGTEEIPLAQSVGALVDAIDEQRRQVSALVAPISDDELQTRNARIPLFKQFMGTEEIPLAQYLGSLFDFPWNDHAGQIAKIRKAVGLPSAG